MKYETQRTVKAPIERVWSVLTNVSDWPRWTDSITSVQLQDDKLALGARAIVDQPGLVTASWTVVAFVDGESFVWESRSPGVLTVGGHYLTALDEDCTHLQLTLESRGIVADMLMVALGGRVRRYVDMEADGLKHSAEQPKL